MSILYICEPKALMTESIEETSRKLDLFTQDNHSVDAAHRLETLLNDPTILTNDAHHESVLVCLIDYYQKLSIHYDLANRHYITLLGIRKKTFGHNHEKVMTVKKDYGIFLTQRRNFNTAMNYLKEYLDWYILKFGEKGSEDVELVDLKFSLGKCYLYNQFLLEARFCFEFCFEKGKAYSNSNNVKMDDKKFIVFSAEYGNVLSLLDMHNSAIAILEENYNVIETMEGATGETTILLMNYLAFAYIRANQISKGNDLYERCMQLKSEKFGSGHESVIEMHQQMISITRRSKRSNDAIQRFVVLFRLCVDCVGGDDTKTLDVLKDFHHFLDSLSNEERMKQLTELYNLQLTLVGKSAVGTLSTLGKLINLLLKLESDENLLDLVNSWITGWMTACSQNSSSSQINQRQVIHDIQSKIERVVAFLISHNYSNYKTSCVKLAEEFVMSANKLNEKSGMTDHVEWLIPIYYRCGAINKLDALFEKQNREAMENFGADSIPTCRALLSRANHLRYCEHFIPAIEDYIRCAALYQRYLSANVNTNLIEQDISLHFEMLVFLDSCYLKNNMHSKGVEPFKVLYESCTNALGERHLVTLNAMVNYAYVDKDISNNFIENTKKVLTPLDKKSNNRDKLRPHLMLVKILKQRGEVNQAISSLGPLLEVLQSNLGDDLMTLEALQLMGEMFCNIGKTSEGTICLQSCYEKCRIVRGDDNPETERLRTILWQGKAAGIMILITFVVLITIVVYILISTLGSRYKVENKEL